MSSTFARIPGALGKGLVAGFAGTLAMTASSTIEMKMRGRKASDAPARATERLVGITPVGEEAKARWNNLVHLGYGTALGLPRGVLGEVLPWPAATAAHFGAAWGGELALLPALKVTPPPGEWGAREVAIDAWHHLVYAVAAGVAYRVIDRAEQRANERLAIGWWRRRAQRRARAQAGQARERSSGLRDRAALLRDRIPAFTS